MAKSTQRTIDKQAAPKRSESANGEVSQGLEPVSEAAYYIARAKSKLGLSEAVQEYNGSAYSISGWTINNHQLWHRTCASLALPEMVDMYSKMAFVFCPVGQELPGFFESLSRIY